MVILVVLVKRVRREQRLDLLAYSLKIVDPFPCTSCREKKEIEVHQELRVLLDYR